MDVSTAIGRALRNVASHGDTDIFPFPFENHLFFDKGTDAHDLLLKLHGAFEEFFAAHPPQTIQALTQIGYTGFRWATLIEPFWNAYYLALVVALSEQIEDGRIPIGLKKVFSYRIQWSESSSTLFADSTWLDYRRHAIEESRSAKYVVVTDIADFYPRIYHHSIENALRRLPNCGDLPYRIMKLLGSFSKGASYGLPIGGPASRILSELVLSATDLHLDRRKIRFCRYADDYCIFCDDRSEAYGYLVLLSEKLFNEGLVLQKNKTRVYTADEFRDISRLLDPKDVTDPLASEEQKLLNVSIRYDPYSASAHDDYEKIKAAIQQIDILGILGRELAKTELDQTVAKQAISAVRALTGFEQDGAIRTLMDSSNLQVLSPVFVTLMRTLRSLYNELPPGTQIYVDDSLVDIYDKGDPLLRVEVNLSYFVLVLGLRRSVRKEEILIELFDRTPSPLVKRIIILIMANWGCHYWLTDQKKKYLSLSLWERRAIILASYVLGDEGEYWRRQSKQSWSEFDALIRTWFAERWQKVKTLPS
jgi:hypothetical protein